MDHINNRALSAPAKNLAKALASQPGTAAQSPKAATASPAEAALVQEAQQAFAAWLATPDGEFCKALMRAGNYEPVVEALQALANGSAFARTRELATVSIDPLDYEAFSLGMVVQADIILGIYASAGYICDFDNISGTSSVYICGAISGGFDIGADVGGQVGFWKKSVAQVDGFYIGGEVIIDDGPGLSALGLFNLLSDEDYQALLIDAEGGFNDGVDGLAFGMLSYGRDTGPVVQKQASHFLILGTLTCINQRESGHDEVYLKFTADNGTTFRYPTNKYYSMSDDSGDYNTWNLGRSVWFDSKVKVDLFDGGDTIGSMTFNFSDFSGPNSSKTVTSKQSYGVFQTIEYSLAAKLIF
jgi:hypothetical protein